MKQDTDVNEEDAVESYTQTRIAEFNEAQDSIAERVAEKLEEIS